MYVIIDIEYNDGIFEITCHNEYGTLRHCITSEQVNAIGLDYIISDIEFMFFKELFRN